MRLAFWMAETEEPYRFAIAERVSPFLTTCRTVFGLTTTGLGLGLGLAATVGLGVVVGLVVVGLGAVVVGLDGGKGVEFGGGWSFFARNGGSSRGVEGLRLPGRRHFVGSSAHSSR